MTRTLIRSGVAALMALLVLPTPAPATTGGARVIVSTTLNNTLLFFDASLTQTQPPLPVKGTSPVRLWVDRFGDRPVLLSANHGVEGSAGAYDLSGDLVTEYPLSPYPARAGAVGISAGTTTEGRSFVFVTNTWQALGGCGLPKGSVTIFEATGFEQTGLMLERTTVETSGAIPYAVDFDAGGARAFASSTCSDTLDTIDLNPVVCIEPCDDLRIERSQTRPTGDGPDAVLFDAERALVYTTNIAGNSVSVHDTATPTARTTVPLPGAGPIDAALGESPSGRSWLFTSNGRDDTISVIDRDAIAACASAGQPICSAQVARIATGVPTGAPEGVAYDPGSNRVFVVNKTPGKPSLTSIQLTEHQDGGVSGAAVKTVPLQALGEDTPVPAFTAFDVVVQPR